MPRFTSQYQAQPHMIRYFNAFGRSYTCRFRVVVNVQLTTSCFGIRKTYMWSVSRCPSSCEEKMCTNRRGPLPPRTIRGAQRRQSREGLAGVSSPSSSGSGKPLCSFLPIAILHSKISIDPPLIIAIFGDTKDILGRGVNRFENWRALWSLNLRVAAPQFQPDNRHDTNVRVGGEKMVLVRPSDYFYAYDAIRQESFQGQSVLVFASVSDVDAVCAYKVLSVRIVERSGRIRCKRSVDGQTRNDIVESAKKKNRCIFFPMAELGEAGRTTER